MHGIKVDLRDLEVEQLKLILKAQDYQSALDDIYNYCRNKLKHEDLSDAVYKELETVKDMIPNLWE